MPTRKSSTIKISLIVLVVILVGIVLFLFYFYQKTILPQQNSPLARVEATKESGELSAVASSDGTVKLVTYKQQTEDGSNNYSFFVTDAAGAKERLLYTKVVAADAAMSVPPNAWSPDNKYVFIGENQPGSVTFLVFKASGETFTNGEQYYDVLSLFTQRKIDHTLTNATGWASPALLIITTNKTDDTKGPSYWFDLDSHSFLQLWR